MNELTAAGIKVYAGQCNIMRALINNRDVFFLSSHSHDVIQREHQAGRFYETEELELIAKHTRPGMSYCDVGANIGNHSIYFGLFLGADRIVCFEPNPRVIPTLRANILLNKLDRICDLSLLGFGLGDKSAEDASISFRPKNTGASRISEGGGTIRVRTGDTLLTGRKVDFLKIDVEGMELEVLRGFAETLERYTPMIFIEIENNNISDVTEYLSALEYEPVEEWRRYPQNVNILFKPKKSSA